MMRGLRIATAWLAAFSVLVGGCAASEDLYFTLDVLADPGIDPAWDAMETAMDPGPDTSADTFADVPSDTLMDTVIDVPFDTYADTIVADTLPDTTVVDTYVDTTVVDTYVDTAVVDTYVDTAVVDTYVDTASDIVVHHTWSEYFDGVSNVSQCASWETFRLGLATSGYTTMTFSGTFDPTGISCTDPIVVQQYADALRTGTGVHLTCGGRVWSMCNRGSHLEAWIDAPSLCDLANCPDPGYIIRPCFSTTNVWCAANADTCIGPSQTVTLDFY